MGEKTWTRQECPLTWPCENLPTRSDRFIPCQMIAWGLVSASQFFLTGKKTFLACRFLLALCTGAVVPNAIMVCRLHPMTKSPKILLPRNIGKLINMCATGGGGKVHELLLHGPRATVSLDLVHRRKSIQRHHLTAARAGDFETPGRGGQRRLAMVRFDRIHLDGLGTPLCTTRRWA